MSASMFPAPSSELSPDDLSTLVSETLARAALQSHRGRLKTIDALQKHIATQAVAGLTPQEARLELDKLIARRLLLLGLPCDLPILTVPAAYDPARHDEDDSADLAPEIADWDRDLAMERETGDIAVFTQEHGFKGWRKRLRAQPKRPGGKPGKAQGPFGPVTHLSRTLDTPTGTFDYYAAWRYDPACHLTVHLGCDGRRQFAFETRCDSFAHAFAHLGATLARRGMSLRLKGFLPGAAWTEDAPECETVRLADGRVVHALSLDTCRAEADDPTETMIADAAPAAPNEA